MRISDLATPYDQALAAFVARLAGRDVASLFHAVRRLGYFSSGDRSPRAVIETGRGACTAKHLLLRDLLRHCGERAEVELIEGDFAAGLPLAATMPPPLQAMIRAGGVADAHCVVIWHAPEGALRLDATWPDALARHGFAVNADWAGQGDTALAITPGGAQVRAEDVATVKAQMLARLSPEQTQRRQMFLGLLSDWMTTLD